MHHRSDVESLLGRWRSLGYGWLLEVQREGVRRWDEYDHGLVVADQWKDIGAFGDWIAEVELRGDRLAFIERDVITRYDWVKVAEPGPRILRPDPDPARGFALLREAFDRHYAFFDLRGGGWAAACDETERDLLAGATDPFDVATRALRSLADGHVKLIAGERVGRSAPVHPVTAIIPDDIEPGRPAWERVAGWATSRLASSLGSNQLSRRANGRLVSTSVDDIGYLAVLAMEDLADPGTGGDLAAVNAALTDVAAEFSACRTVVVDVRYNAGGDDPVALAIAGWFADRERLAWTKSARAGEGWTAPQAVLVRPSTMGRIRRPVILITGSYTASAAEAFVLAMRVLPTVTVVGARTAGVLSDQLLKHLPNGWRVTISNERCQAADGHVYEGSGIPVDIALDDDLPNGGDATSRAALDIARSG